MTEVSQRVICLAGRKVRLGLLDRKTDFDRCLRWMNDAEVAQFIKRQPPVSVEEEEEFFANLSKRKNDHTYAVETFEGRHIGNIGLHRIDRYSRTATTGTIIGEKDCWGKGYGSDAKMTLLDFAFNTLGLEKVNSSVFEFNERSLRYVLRCGYREEGRSRSQVFRYGMRWDAVQLGILREEFAPVLARYRAETAT